VITLWGAINRGARLRLLGEVQAPAVNKKRENRNKKKRAPMQDFITRETTKCVWATN
jgi:hypothetical protein